MLVNKLFAQMTYFRCRVVTTSYFCGDPKSIQKMNGLYFLNRNEAFIGHEIFDISYIEYFNISNI